MYKKLIVIALVAGALAPFANAGTEVIRDYGQDQYHNYAPAPRPRPVYYAPPPPVVIYPRPFFYRPWFGYHRFYGHRFHHWR